MQESDRCGLLGGAPNSRERAEQLLARRPQPRLGKARTQGNQAICNLYRLDAPANHIAATIGADTNGDVWAGGYVAPGSYAPVIIGGKDGMRRMAPRQCGVPPPPKGNHVVTNVRNLVSPFWIGTLRHTEFRCLVPATRFQEMGRTQGGKNPALVHRAVDAGLCLRWNLAG